MCPFFACRLNRTTALMLFFALRLWTFFVVVTSSTLPRLMLALVVANL